jgi:hypothetical protein
MVALGINVVLDAAMLGVASVAIGAILAGHEPWWLRFRLDKRMKRRDGEEIR